MPAAQATPSLLLAGVHVWRLAGFSQPKDSRLLLIRKGIMQIFRLTYAFLSHMLLTQ